MKIAETVQCVVKGIQHTAEVAASLKGIYDTGKYLYAGAQAAAPYLAAVAAAV